MAFPTHGLALRRRLRNGRSADISDGNRDGNNGSRQQPEAAINSRTFDLTWASAIPEKRTVGSSIRLRPPACWRGRSCYTPPVTS
jgi:hypothetical protein